jgi:hypothetical protein
VTITGTGGSLTRSTSIALTVEEKRPFGISGNASQPFSPGATVPLDLTLDNPNPFTLEVAELVVSVEHQTTKAGCDGLENYSAEQIPASRYPISLPARSTRTLSSLGVAVADRPAVTMNNLINVDQSACQGATVYFDYSGGATK